jgi:hypothetical protein
LCPQAQSEIETDENYVEGSEHKQTNFQRKLWRIKDALKMLKADTVIAAKVGNVLWRMTEESPQTGCDVWVAWLKDNGVSDEDARSVWADGFPEWAWADEVYEAAQRVGWRLPITHDPNRLLAMAERSEATLVGIGADIYQFGDRLVFPISEEIEATKGRKTRIALPKRIDYHFLMGELSRYINFVKWDDEDHFKTSAVPSQVASLILSRYGMWKFRKLAGVVCCQTLRRDGTILAKEGYDEATGLYVMGPLPKMRRVAERPTRAEAEKALASLGELLAEFPFVDMASRSVALSGLMTSVCRAALDCVPMHAMSAPAPGSGKSFWCDIASGIATGNAMPVIGGENMEEIMKAFNTLIMKGATLFSIDNVTVPVNHDQLSQAIERLVLTLRILGKSETVERRNNWSIFCTGNNLRMRDDTTRRTLLARIDAKVERPELRPFKSNPFDKVLEDRGHYLWAVFTIVLAYRAAGMPGRLPGFGDPYQQWSDLIRSALVWLGEEDPVKSMEAVRENDPNRQARAALFWAIKNAYGGEPRTTGQMIADAKSNRITPLYTTNKPKPFLDRPSATDDEGVALHDAIIGYTNDRWDTKYFGRKLGTDLNQIADGLRLCRVPVTGNQFAWFVEEQK